MPSSGKTGVSPLVGRWSTSARFWDEFVGTTVISEVVFNRFADQLCHRAAEFELEVVEGPDLFHVSQDSL